jgi:hypothetical protein
MVYSLQHMQVLQQTKYMLQQATKVIRSWFVQTYIGVAITHHYALQHCNSY